MSTTLNKSFPSALLAPQSVAASSVLISSVVDMYSAGKLGGMVYAKFGRRSATAAGASANLRLEFCDRTSGDYSWFPWWEAATAFAACESEAVNGTVSSGTNVVTVASTTNLTAGDKVFIDNGTIANSEWGRVKSIVASTSITLEDNLVNAQTSATIYDSAEIYNAIIIPQEAMRWRFVADGSLFTQAFAIEVRYTLVDSIG